MFDPGSPMLDPANVPKTMLNLEKQLHPVKILKSSARPWQPRAPSCICTSNNAPPRHLNFGAEANRKPTAITRCDDAEAAVIKPCCDNAEAAVIKPWQFFSILERPQNQKAMAF